MEFIDIDIITVKIKIQGYVDCHSSFYSCTDVIQDNEYVFQNGINFLCGEIDSGGFGISYYISMYKKINKKTIPSNPSILVNGEKVSADELSGCACYLDVSYPLFRSRRSVNAQIKRGLKKSKSNYTTKEVCQMFGISDFRAKRKISATGNEKFQSMAAIGFAYGKQIYCLPWLSKMRYEGYNNHIPYLLKVLEEQKKITIVPVGT